MGRKQQALTSDVTVSIVRGPGPATAVEGEGEVMRERWYRAMAILLDPKFDDPADIAVPTATVREPIDELTARLEMACGLYPAESGT